MWWLLGGLVAVIAGLVAVIARRGGSMDGQDHDGHGQGAAQAIHGKNNSGVGGTF